jgi:hypothetical protein
MTRAGKPEAPYNCTLTNQTTESLSVECTAGFDGGQPQHFLLEVFDQHTEVLQANVTSRENAAFTVQGLEPGKVLNMILYAVNAKGRSDPTLLEGFTLKVAEKQTGKLCPEIFPFAGSLGKSRLFRREGRIAASSELRNRETIRSRSVDADPDAA